MKKIALIIVLLVVPSIASAKERRTTINSSTVSNTTKRNLIATSYFGKSYSKLNWKQKTGVKFAASRAKIVFDPNCSGHLLVWQEKHVWWGMAYWKRMQKRKSVKKQTTIKGKKHHQYHITNITHYHKHITINNYGSKRVKVVKRTVVTHHTGKYSTCPVCKKNHKSHHGHIVDCDNCKSWHKHKMKTSIKVVKKVIVIRKPAPVTKSKPYVDSSRTSVRGFFLDERLQGQQFSRGGGVLINSQNYVWRKSLIVRLDFNLNVLGTNYMQPGSFTGANAQLNLLFGSSWGNGTMVLAGLSADVMGGKDSYGGFNVNLSEGALKAMVLVRYDSKWISFEGRMAVGGGAQTVMDTSGLFRLDGLLKLEGHLGKHLDLEVYGGIRYDRLTASGVVRDNTTLLIGSLLRLKFRYGLGLVLGVEAGTQNGNLGKATHITPNVGLEIRY